MSMYEEQQPGRGVVHPIQRLHAVVLGAMTSAGIPDPDAHEELFQGITWLGDLAGMEVVPVLREGPQGPNLQLRLTHRCGNEGVLLANHGMDGMSADGAIMLGNLVEFAAQWREGHVCPPHQPSPEHQALMQRWTDSSSGGARPVVDREDGPQAGLLTNGPMQAVGLETEGQRLFREGRHAEAEIPLAREILGDEAAEQLAARRWGEHRPEDPFPTVEGPLPQPAVTDEQLMTEGQKLFAATRVRLREDRATPEPADIPTTGPCPLDGDCIKPCATQDNCTKVAATVKERSAQCCGHITCKGEGPCGYIIAATVDDSVRCRCTGSRP